jgi:hypothetical protein
LPLDGLDPFAVAAFLTACLSERSPEFASRLARLTNRQARILYDHLKQQRPAEVKPAAFTRKELQAIAVACETFPLTSRFLRHLRRWLIPLLQEVFPALARKVSSLSDGQFERLYEHIKARQNGSR